MASANTTSKNRTLQIVLLPGDQPLVESLAKTENRSRSSMGAVLIHEALVARKLLSNSTIAGQDS